MCSNYSPIKINSEPWVQKHFGCLLPNSIWRNEVYPTYPAPFIYLNEGKPKCELAEFGLRPFWAKDKKFGLRTYNARSETVAEKPSYTQAWKERRFGLAIMDNFYEPNWETGKAVRWKIKPADLQPFAVASIFERYIEKETGEVIFSFSMLTINADNHPVMKHFHKPDDEKRSIVVLTENDYLPWLNASHDQPKDFLTLAKNGFLICEASPTQTR
ncbi:MAG: SOS response-associated peptidase family protein [Bdellovibrio sp.]|nr:SOS response-associated peptidase family protein [Methylotenera sp.]